MSVLDTFLTSIGLGKVHFTNYFPTDKILATGTQTITNDGATNQAPQSAKVTTTSIANPAAKQCFVRYVWSVDGINFNSAETHLIYTFTDVNPGGSTTLTGLKAAVSVGVSSTSIIFLTGNGLHGNVSDNGVTYTYTPTSQVFTIKYALYEI